MGVAGEARNCPHCGQQILRSAGYCPACQRRLRFDGAVRAPGDVAATCPFSVEGAIRHPAEEPVKEYSVLVEIRDSQGAVLAKHMVGVGAIQPGDTRIFSLKVEMMAAEDSTREAVSRAPHHDGAGGKTVRDDQGALHDPKRRGAQS